MLIVEHPSSYAPERQYILHVLLSRFLGLEYQSRATETRQVTVSMQDDPSGRQLIMPDVLFQTPQDGWRGVASLPAQPLKVWDLSAISTVARLSSSRLPVIYGEGAQLVSDTTSPQQQQLHLGLDIFGSAFFMLTRYEEAVKTDRDAHGRFPAGASLALQEGFLDRPIVNEYLQVLRWALRSLWPALSFRQHSPRVLLTHDVDSPLGVAGKPLAVTIRRAAGDAIHQRDLGLALRRLYAHLAARCGNWDRDVNNTFDWIMDLSERSGLQSAFYFMANVQADPFSDPYDLCSPWIRRLLRRIHDRGHEIGLHPCYRSFDDPALVGQQFQRLQEACADEGITPDTWGGRQHYLRWDTLSTWDVWEQAGLQYDSTVSYADRVGFRCGVCYEYPAFSLAKRAMLRLEERPLIAMDVSLWGGQQMGLTMEQAGDKLEQLYRACRLFDGDFVVLWHNTSLLSRQQRQAYRRLHATLQSARPA